MNWRSTVFFVDWGNYTKFNPKPLDSKKNYTTGSETRIFQAGSTKNPFRAKLTHHLCFFPHRSSFFHILDDELVHQNPPTSGFSEKSHVLWGRCSPEKPLFCYHFCWALAFHMMSYQSTQQNRFLAHPLKSNFSNASSACATGASYNVLYKFIKKAAFAGLIVG